MYLCQSLRQMRSAVVSLDTTVLKKVPGASERFIFTHCNVMLLFATCQSCQVTSKWS